MGIDVERDSWIKTQVSVKRFVLLWVCIIESVWKHKVDLIQSHDFLSAAPLQGNKIF